MAFTGNEGVNSHLRSRQTAALKIHFYQVVFSSGILLYLLIINWKNDLSLSDEGMYLLSASLDQPDYGVQSPFPIVTTLLFQLSGESLFIFRAVSFLILYLASVSLVKGMINLSNIVRVSVMDKIWVDWILGPLIITSFAHVDGIYTPSYNSINFLSTVIILAALTRTINALSSYPLFILNSLYLGIGITLSFFSKPILGIGIILALLVNSFFPGKSTDVFHEIRIRRKGVIFTLSSAVLSFVTLLLWNSKTIADVYYIYRRGRNWLLSLDEQYQFSWSIVHIITGPRDATVNFVNAINLNQALIFFGVLSVGISANLFSKQFVHRHLYLPWSLSIFFIFISLQVSSSPNMRISIVGILYYALAIIILQQYLGTFFATTTANLNDSKLIKQKVRSSLFGVVTIATTFVYPFGSNNGYAPGLVRVAGILIVWMLVQYLDDWSSLSFIFRISTFFLSLVIVVSSTMFPIDGHNKFKSNHLFESEFNNARSANLDLKTYRFLSHIQTSLINAGWSPQNRILDLSDFNTGIVYLIDGLPTRTIIPATPGYPNVNNQLQYSLKNEMLYEDFDPADWWVMIGFGPEAKEREVVFKPNANRLSLWGLDIDKDFELVVQYGNFSIFKPRTKQTSP